MRPVDVSRSSQMATRWKDASLERCSVQRSLGLSAWKGSKQSQTYPGVC